MKKNIVIANWKMNPQSAQEARRLFDTITKGIRRVKKTDVVICPPFVHLPDVKSVRHTQKVFLGSQDIFWEEKGAYTGEISSRMLQSFGVTHVIIGHSERRRWLGETDEMINNKIKTALKAGLVPILCVGEWVREIPGEIPDIVENQVRSALKGLKKGDFKNGIIAYEPVWAIGTGRPETPDNAAKAALFIRKIVRDILGKKTAEHIRVIYGGSVNAESFISKDIRGMEGILVGGASLRADDFIKIVKSV